MVTSTFGFGESFSGQRDFTDMSIINRSTHVCPLQSPQVLHYSVAVLGRWVVISRKYLSTDKCGRPWLVCTAHCSILHCCPESVDKSKPCPITKSYSKSIKQLASVLILKLYFVCSFLWVQHPTCLGLVERTNCPKIGRASCRERV